MKDFLIRIRTRKMVSFSIKFMWLLFKCQQPLINHANNGWLSPEAFEQKYFKSLEGSAVHNTV